MTSLLQTGTAKQPRRIVLKVALAAAVACSAVAVVQSTVRSPVPVRVEVLPLDATVLARNPTVSTVRVSNISNSPIDVVGIQDGCFDTCCLRALDRFRARIAPRQSADFRLELSPRGAGPFGVNTSLWIATDVVTAYPVTLSGVASPTAGAVVPTE
jgi:hypothetical protein